MTDTSFFAPEQRTPLRRPGAPHIAGTAVAFTDHRYSQDEVANALTEFTEPAFARFALSSGVEHRNLALPVDRYRELTGFTLSLIHISEPTRQCCTSRMPSSA